MLALTALCLLSTMAAAGGARAGIENPDYDADDFLGLCPATPMPDWQDIIEMKQQEKPPMTVSKPLG